MKKPPPLLTPRIIADLRTGDERADPDHPGLRVRRTNAVRVFFYRYRARDGALREIKLGEFGPMTLAEARKALGRLKLERERGADPQMEKQQARVEARRQREAENLARYTVEKLVDDYISEKLSKQKRGDEGARLLRRELLSRLGERPAAGVTRRELQDEVIRPMLNRAPRCGTYLLGRIGCAYAHAVEQGRLADDFVSPTLGIKGAPQVRRKRVFSEAELATFVRWLPRSPYSRTVRDALALVLFTGCRSGEVVAALWRGWPSRRPEGPRCCAIRGAQGEGGHTARRPDRDPLDGSRPAPHRGDGAGEARLPARGAGSHPQSRRQLGERDLRPASLRRRSAGVAAETGRPL
jgi:hypothetical protein